MAQSSLAILLSALNAAPLNIFLFALAGFALCRSGIIIYRLFFHPLRSFPGPTLAAATTLYRAYYQVWRDGEHVAQYTRLHEAYGPVVRIAPNKLHFRNPQAFDDIFKFNTKFTKDLNFYDHLGQSEALFGMVDEEEHKERFKMVADLFSKRKQQEFEPLIDSHTDRLCGLLLKLSDEGKPINIAAGLRAVALDIVQDFVFEYVPTNLRGLRDEKFDTLFVKATFDVMDWTAWCFRNFPFALTCSNQLPQWLRQRILPGEAANIESFDTIMKLVAENVAMSPEFKRDTMLSRMANKVSLINLTSECMGTMFGGVINLANMLPYGVFCVASDEALNTGLLAELTQIWPDADAPIPAYSELIKLPILNGVVKESLRLMHGIIVGPPRQTPPTGAQVDGHYIPAGTVVTTSSFYLHMNPEVFPDPCSFNPSHWTNASPEMEKALVPFSRGKRMCPGKELSLMEMYIVIATVLRRFKIEPHETTIEDFDWKVYISLHFKGRMFHAIMKPRDGYRGLKNEYQLRSAKV